MRQIGSRQEASRLGGIGSCGRELCCSTWLTDFRSVSTSAARYQQLSLNPQKLAGQCGKLKCCLNYELDMYLDAIKSFPAVENKLYTEKGAAFHVKTDVFKRLMWYMYEGGSGLIALSPERVAEVRELNINKVKPQDLKDFSHKEEVIAEPDYENVDEQDSLNRFDSNFKKKKKKKPNRPAGQAPNPNQVNASNGNLAVKVNPPRPNPNQNPNRNPNQKSNPNQVGNPNQKMNQVQNEQVKPVQMNADGTTPFPRKNKKRRPPRKPNPDGNSSNPTGNVE